MSAATLKMIKLSETMYTSFENWEPEKLTGKKCLMFQNLKFLVYLNPTVPLLVELRDPYLIEILVIFQKCSYL